MTNLESLLSQAAHIGADTRAKIDAEKALLDRSRQQAATARENLTSRERAASGFAAPRFDGLVEIANLYGSAFNDSDSQDARDAANAVTQSFVASFTGQTDKTAAGGKFAGYRDVVRLGANAKRAQIALQQRLDHWQAVQDTPAGEGEKPAEAAARIAEAKRYTVVCGVAPDVEGGAIVTSPKGEVTTPKFNGRPSRVVRGVDIAFGRATNRDAQMAAFARLFAQHGDVVLLPEVVDAFLDNGGRFKADSEETIESAAGAALAALDSLMAMGGKSSGDAASLMAAHFVIERIMKQGFKASTAAPAQDDAQDDAQDAALPASEPEDALSGIGGEATPPAAPEAAGAPSEGEGVTLGAAPAKRTRPSRRKAGEVQPGA